MLFARLLDLYLEELAVARIYYISVPDSLVLYMLHVCTDKRHATATRNAPPQRGRSTKRALAELSSLSDLRAYGERSRRTRLFGDQLWRAEAGSWQIADGGATQKAAAGGTSVGDLRVHFVVEL